MKEKFLLFSLVLATGLAQAQTSPIITADDMPTVGDTLRLSQAGLPATAPPLTRNGANQTWDYSGLVATSQRVERYAEVNTAAGPLLQITFNNPYFSPDNQATLVVARPLPTIGALLPLVNPLEFFNLSTTNFRLVGYGITFNGTAIPLTYATKIQQDIIYQFPLSYPSAADVSNSLLTTPTVVAATGYLSQKRQRRNQPDAWGAITTPFGTFQAVRLVTTITDHDSVAYNGNNQGFTLPVTHEYKWLAKGIHVPVLTITTTSVAGQEIVASVEYRDKYRRFTSLATRDAATDAVLRAYPNPSAVGTDLRLALPLGSGPLTLAATDLVGRQLFSRSVGASAAGVVTLEAQALGNYRGVLLLTVQTAQGTATRRVVRE